MERLLVHSSRLDQIKDIEAPRIQAVPRWQHGVSSEGENKFLLRLLITLIYCNTYWLKRD